MDLEEKTIWKTPELIALVRSKPEEAVLATCKHSGSSGPISSQTGCKTKSNCTGAPCSSGGKS